MPKIDKLFTFALENNASDLHLSTGRRPMIRIHGEIMPMKAAVLTQESLMELLREITPEKAWKEYAEHFDADYAYEMTDGERWRCNIFTDMYGICAVFRWIPSKVWTVEEVGLSEDIQKLCFMPKGLVLVTGPTGSGKSTTLAAMIDLINKRRNDHIISIEDPIEFVHKPINCTITQREVGVHTNSFPSALRAALREDPDVVLVGEMRDLETIESAIEMAATGHLVFGTLHTTTAYTTVDRMINQFPEDEQNQIRMMLSDSLKAVISQTLLKTSDGKGRVCAMEVLIVHMGVAAQIREGQTKKIPSAIETGGQFGMVALNDSLIRYVLEGRVGVKEAYLKAIDKKDFENKLKAAGYEVDLDALITGSMKEQSH